MNWISATGRSPVNAHAEGVPTMADSASGVSNTRFGPNWLSSPSVARKHAPKLSDVLPMTMTRSFSDSAWRSARLMASTNERLVMHVPRRDERYVAARLVGYARHRQRQPELM